MNQEIYNKTTEVLKNFKDSEKRMMTSPLFNRVVQMLARDVNVYDVINELITITEDTNRAFEQYILRDTRPISFSKE
jgi:hypothetical protein